MKWPIESLWIEEDHNIIVLMVPDRPEGGPDVTSANYKAIEISREGVHFLTLNPIAEGSFVRVDVQLKDGSKRTLSLSGIIREIHTPEVDYRYRINVEFFQLPHDPDWKKWITYTDSLIKDRN